MEDRYKEFVREYRRLLEKNIDPKYVVLAANLRMSKSTVAKYMTRLSGDYPDLVRVGVLVPSRILEKAFNKAVDEGMQEKTKAFEQVLTRHRENEQALMEESEQRLHDLEMAHVEITQLKDRVTKLEAQCAAAQASQQRAERQLRESQRELDRCQEKLKDLPALEQQVVKAADLGKTVIGLQAKLDSEVDHKKTLISETREFMEKIEAEKQALKIENALLKKSLEKGQIKPAGVPPNGTPAQGNGTRGQSGGAADPIQ